MDQDRVPGTSMLGALLVAEGLVATEQLAACLLLQQHDYPHLQIGEILLRCGYIGHEQLGHALRLQRTMRESLVDAVELQMPIQGGIAVLVIARRPSDVLSTILGRLGAVATYSSTIPEDIESLRPDLVLVEASRLHVIDQLPDWCLVQMLPEINRYLFIDTVPMGMAGMLERAVHQAGEERARRSAHEDRRQRDFELDALTRLTRGIAEATQAHDLLTRMLELVRETLKVEAASLFRSDARNQRLVFEVVLGPNQEELVGKAIPITQGIAGWVARHGEPLILPDVRQDKRFANSIDHSTGFQTRSMLCVPMSAFGALYGVVQLINKRDGEFDERDLQLLRTIVSYGALAMAGRASLGLRSAFFRQRPLFARA